MIKTEIERKREKETDRQTVTTRKTLADRQAVSARRLLHLILTYKRIVRYLVCRYLLKYEKY